MGGLEGSPEKVNLNQEKSNQIANKNKRAETRRFIEWLFDQ